MKVVSMVVSGVLLLYICEWYIHRNPRRGGGASSTLPYNKCWWVASGGGGGGGSVVVVVTLTCHRNLYGTLTCSISRIESRRGFAGIWSGVTSFSLEPLDCIITPARVIRHFVLSSGYQRERVSLFIPADSGVHLP